MANFHGILIYLLVGICKVRSINNDLCQYPERLNRLGRPFKTHEASQKMLKMYRGGDQGLTTTICSEWGSAIGKTTTISMFIARSMKDIKMRWNQQCAFGMRRGRNVFLCQVSKRCHKVPQQRIFQHHSRECRNPEETLNVIDFHQGHDSTWTLHNNGRGLEIKINPPGSVTATIEEDRHHIKELRVKRIIIKSGEDHLDGIEHVFGHYQYAGEVQIFFEHHDSDDKKYAMSFFIQERNSPSNAHWSKHFLNKLQDVTEIGSTTDVRDGTPTLKNLIFEDLRSSVEDALSRYWSYTGPGHDSSCEEHQWTIFRRTIALSTYQMQFLRSLKKERLPQSLLKRRRRNSRTNSHKTYDYCHHR